MLKSYKSIKLTYSVNFRMRLPGKLFDGEIQEMNKHYDLSSTEIYNVDHVIIGQFQKLLLRENANQLNAGSGWSLLKCDQQTDMSVSIIHSTQVHISVSYTHLYSPLHQTLEL